MTSCICHGFGFCEQITAYEIEKIYLIMHVAEPVAASEASIVECLRRRNGNNALFEQARSYALEYMRTIGERRVFPSAHDLASLKSFEEDLPQEPADGAVILETLDRVGSPATVAQTGGRYFGFVNGGALPAALAAKWLADIWDQNAGMLVGSPVTASTNINFPFLY
jgi:hypothetical protein